MSYLTSDIEVPCVDLFGQLTVTSITAAPNENLNVIGSRAVTADGRSFRFIQVGASNVTPGMLLQAPAIVANHQGLTPTAVSAIGDSQVTVTLGATAATANQYSGGFLLVQSGTTGAGQTLQIKSHPAANASATLVLTLSDSFQIATSGTITMNLIPSLYKGVIVCPTTPTNAVIGVAMTALTATNYGWLQTHGECALLASATIAANASVSPSAATAGAVITATAGSQIVGFAAQAGANTQYNSVFLTID